MDLVIVPEVGWFNPAINLRRVLFPAPLGPTIAVRHPRSKLMDTLLRAGMEL